MDRRTFLFGTSLGRGLGATERLSVLGAALRGCRLVVPRLGPQPFEEFVAVEAHLAPTGEAVTRHLAVAHELAQVLDVHLEQFGGVGGGEYRGEIGRRFGLGWGHASYFTPHRTPR